MSIFTIPDSVNRIRQLADTDVEGELVESFSIDLTSRGKIKPSKKLVKVLDETDISNGVPQALAIYDDEYWLATDDDVYFCSVNDDPTVLANWTLETDISGTGLSFQTDMEVFGGLLLISASTDITSWNGSVDDTDWWDNTISGSALTTGKPHIMHVHRGGQETLFVTDGNLIRYYNATSGHSTVTLQSDLTACCVSSGVSAIWVGTYVEGSSNAYVYEIYVGEQIDGVTVARNAYKVEGRAVLSIQVIDNVPYIITEKGNLQAFNGSGFTTIAQLPFANTEDVLKGVTPGLIQDSNTARPVHPKGMQTNNNSLYININTEMVGGKYPTATPSGVWEYNTKTGVLNHRFAFSETATRKGGKIMGSSGPILVLDNEDTLMLACGGLYDGNTGLYAVSNTADPYGYFVTREIASGTVTDTYEAVYLKASKVTGSDTIDTAYRIVKLDKTPATGAWTDTKSINLTGIVSVSKGDEMTILTGTNTGSTAYVTEVTTTATLTVVTLDTAIGTIGETQDVEFQNWTKLSGQYTVSDGEFKKIGVGQTNPWIQYKVVMNGELEFRQFISKGNSKNEL